MISIKPILDNEDNIKSVFNKADFYNDLTYGYLTFNDLLNVAKTDIVNNFLLPNYFSNIEFSSSINSISASTFQYISNVTTDIQSQFDYIITTKSSINYVNAKDASLLALINTNTTTVNTKLSAIDISLNDILSTCNASVTDLSNIMTRIASLESSMLDSQSRLTTIAPIYVNTTYTISNLPGIVHALATNLLITLPECPIGTRFSVMNPCRLQGAPNNFFLYSKLTNPYWSNTLTVTEDCREFVMSNFVVRSGSGQIFNYKMWQTTNLYVYDLQEKITTNIMNVTNITGKNQYGTLKIGNIEYYGTLLKKTYTAPDEPAPSPDKPL